MTTPTEFNCNDNSSTGSDIDRSAPADPLTTHSASSLSTSYSLDPLRPSPTLFHPISSSADATTNLPATRSRPVAGGAQPVSLPLDLLNRPGRCGKRDDTDMVSGDCLDGSSSLQVSPGTLKGALDDNDKDLVNLTTTGISQCGSNPARSMTNKNGRWSMNASVCDPTMCSMNGGLTFRHMLHEPSEVPSHSARNSSCSSDTDPGDAVIAVRESTATCDTGGKANQACRTMSKSASPSEPLLTFRAMLPSTPEEQAGDFPHDHEMRSSPATSDGSPVPSLGSDLTDPNAGSPVRQANHLDCYGNDCVDARDNSNESDQDVLRGNSLFFSYVSMFSLHA